MIQDMTHIERQQAAEWKPVLADKSEPDYLAIREAQVKDEYFRKHEYPYLSPEKKNLFLIREEKRKRNEAEAARLEREDHLAQFEVDHALTRLRAIRDEITNDPDRAESELLRVERTIRQWETPGFDPDVANEMLGEVEGIENARFDAAEFALNQRLAEIEGEKQKLLAKRGRIPAPVVDKPAEIAKVNLPNTASLADKVIALESAFLDLPQYRMDDVVSAANARRALEKGDSGPAERLVERFGNVVDVEATTNEQ